MSQSILPPRARCIHVGDGTSVPCHCPWFNAPSLPLLNQLGCVECGHGIHAHVDYESKVVYHNPATHCAAYAQKAYQSQACTCTVQLFDHEPIVNAYRSTALSHSPAPLTSSLNSVTPSNGDTTRSSGDAINSTPIPSINVNASRDFNATLLAPVPVPFHSNSIPCFSQSDAYSLASHQQLDGASLIYDFADTPAEHHTPEGHHDFQAAPSANPYA